MGYLLGGAVLLAASGLSLLALLFADRAPRFLWLWALLALVLVNALLSIGCGASRPATPAPARCVLTTPPPYLHGGNVLEATDAELVDLHRWATRAWGSCAPLGADAPYPRWSIYDDG